MPGTSRDALPGRTGQVSCLRSFFVWRRAPAAVVDASYFLRPGDSRVVSIHGRPADETFPAASGPTSGARETVRARSSLSVLSSRAASRETVARRALTRLSAFSKASALAALWTFAALAAPRPPLAFLLRAGAPIERHVLVAGPPDSGVEVDQLVLVESRHLGLLRLPHEDVFVFGQGLPNLLHHESDPRRAMG
ncbi:hypothetical protein HW572_03405 [Gordonia amicalis]|nr:hypothetical protein [Gordonia amicalis]